MLPETLEWSSLWPEFTNGTAPLVFNCDPALVVWITKHKTFFFRAKDFARTQPLFPALLTCSANDRRHHTERFRCTGARYVGAGYVSQFVSGGVADGEMLYVAVSLVRVGKPEYDLLANEPHVFRRGRRPVTAFRVEDFVSSSRDRAILTHWLANPARDEVENPLSAYIGRLLPARLREMCATTPIHSQKHPFASSFQIDRRLLPDDENGFTFIDLFAGIGGFRMAMQQEGGKCVFASEIDDNATRTYMNNFGVKPFGDITAGETKAMIPAHFDILCAGFPCQAFSMAGLRQGFDDELQRGTLYRQIVEISRHHQPKAIFCENVKGLLSSADGQALHIILTEIEGAGYHIVFDNILNSRNYGVPQNRERLYIVAIRNDLFEIMRQRNIVFPARPDQIPGNHARTLGEVLEEGPVSKSYYLGQQYLNTLIAHRNRHADAGRSGFGYIVRERNGIAGTLMCGGMGRERNMIHDENQPDWNPTPHMLGGINDQHLRFLTVREWARLQGFPDYFQVPESIQAGYRQFGNCVTVKTIRAVGRAILNILNQCEQEVDA